MKQVPEGWRWSTIGEAGRVQLGRQRHPDWHNGPNMHPYLRVANVFEDHIDAADVKQMDFTGCFERYKLEVGDVLLNEGQSPEFLGRPAIYRGVPPGAAFTNTLIRFQAGPDVTSEWALTVFRHYMHSGRFAQESRITTNIAHLSASRLKSVEFPIPPLEEQQRIVAVLDDHLSRLDAAEALLESCHQRIRAVVWGALSRIRDGESTELGNVAEIQGGIQKQQRRTPRSNAYPFLRVANVTDRGLDLSEVHKIELFGDELSRLRLSAGDLLVVEGNGSPSQIGRAAIWDGSIADCVHQNHLIRVRPSEKLLPEYLEAIWNSRENREALTNLSSSSSGLHTLSVAKLKRIQVPVPSLAEQQSAVRFVSQVRDDCRRLELALGLALQRSLSLRRSLLSAAFAGELTSGSGLNEEVA